MDTEINKAMDGLRKASAARAEKILDLRAKGLSHAQIAKLLDISRQRVYQILDRHNASKTA
jgi:DNA-binding CsgD family transcriptional regulator